MPLGPESDQAGAADTAGAAGQIHREHQAAIDDRLGLGAGQTDLGMKPRQSRVADTR